MKIFLVKAMVSAGSTEPFTAVYEATIEVYTQKKEEIQALTDKFFTKMLSSGKLTNIEEKATIDDGLLTTGLRLISNNKIWEGMDNNPDNPYTNCQEVELPS